MTAITDTHTHTITFTSGLLPITRSPAEKKGQKQASEEKPDGLQHEEEEEKWCLFVYVWGSSLFTQRQVCVSLSLSKLGSEA